MWFTVKGILWFLKTLYRQLVYSVQNFWQNWVWFVFAGGVYLYVKTVNFNILKTLNFVFDCRIWFVYTVLLLIFSFLIIILDKNLCHICCVWSVSQIFSNHLIKLFWCLTVVVGLIYYIRIFVKLLLGWDLVSFVQSQYEVSLLKKKNSTKCVYSVLQLALPSMLHSNVWK